MLVSAVTLLICILGLSGSTDSGSSEYFHGF